MVLVGLILIGFLIFLSQFLSLTAMVVLCGGAMAIGVAIARPQLAAYALAFFAPMSGLVIDFTRDQSLARLPYVGSINAPVVDIFAVATLVLIALLFLIHPEKIALARATKFWQILLALYVVLAISVAGADSLFFGITLKAFFRPYIFMYVGFAVPIILLLKTRVDLLRALFAYECAALVGALMGAISFVTQNVVGFARAMPFSVAGYAPFGVNHNVLAESLTAIIPFAWWFAAKHPRGGRRALLFAAAGFISVIALLTFSRAAWIVMTLQVCFYMWWRTNQTEHHRGRSIGIVVALAALGIFFMIIQSTVIADSSDNTRKDLLGIAVTYWQRAPWFGHGPGMYLPLVNETTAFHMDYGDAMDAHGVVQKLMLETGVVGTMLFGVYVLCVLRALWMRRDSHFHLMLFVTVISLGTYQLFNTGYFDGKVWVLMGVAIASIL